MKKIIIFLCMSLIFISQIYRALSQTRIGDAGFWVEIYDKHPQDLISKNFISLETIKTLPVDSVLTEVKNEETTRIWFGANLCELLETALNISCEKIDSAFIFSENRAVTASGKNLERLQFRNNEIFGEENPPTLKLKSIIWQCIKSFVVNGQAIC